MVKTEKAVEKIEATPPFAWGVGLLAWFIPGLGHLLVKRWVRAALMGGSVWLCFFLGMSMGGHMFSMSTGQSSSWLQVPPMIANMGSGVLYLACWMLDIGFADDLAQAARTTYEYGNTFLLIAGLLNYLTMLDAFDIAAGRKQ